jgi:hypothetical protein
MQKTGISSVHNLYMQCKRLVLAVSTTCTCDAKGWRWQCLQLVRAMLIADVGRVHDLVVAMLKLRKAEIKDTLWHCQAEGWEFNIVLKNCSATLQDNKALTIDNLINPQKMQHDWPSMVEKNSKTEWVFNDTYRHIRGRRQIKKRQLAEGLHRL